MTNIAVLVSGGGTNLQALIDAEAAGKIENGGIRLVVSSNPNAFALERAAKAGIETAVLRRKEYDSAERYGEALDALLREKEIGLIVLAGFMTVLPDSFCAKYENRIINVHPSLIPSFCGEGFYGLRVHEAALATGDLGVVEYLAETGFFHLADGNGAGNVVRERQIDVCFDELSCGHAVKTCVLREDLLRHCHTHNSFPPADCD